MVNKVLVVGGSNVGKKSLVQAVLGAGATSTHETSSRGVTIRPWSLDTKYYNATLHFWVVDSPVYEASFSDSSISEHLLEETQAIILTFDMTSRESYDKVRRWAHAIKAHEKYSPSVLLLVGTKKDLVDDAIHSVSAEDCILWCLDSSYEFIDANCLEPVVEKEPGFLDESEGVARIVEALHANMWSDMAMKQRRNGGMDSVPTTADTVAPVTKQILPSPQPAASSDTGLPQVRGIDFLKEDPDTFENEDDMEKSATNFETMLASLMRMKTQAQGLPMEERKALAAQVAMRFWKQMSAEDEDDEEDGGDDDFYRVIQELDEEIAVKQKEKSESSQDR